MKIRRAVTALALAAAPLVLAAAPAQAWECNKMDLCREATMTVCMVVTDALGDPACH